MASPIDLFFKMGDYATKGDPRRQQDFTYYMLWILFLAFGIMFVTNFYRLVVFKTIDNLWWAMIGFAIMSLQFFSLKQMYELRKIRTNSNTGEVETIERIENVDEMMEGFKDGKGK